MRNEFIGHLRSISESREDTFLIVGDLGYGVVEPFKLAFPSRFLNAGVAEQSMMTVAAGVASQGSTVFVYSIANFPTFRALEQIRNDVVAHQLPVTVVSVGAGLAYGTLGYTHHAIEDLTIMRALDGIDIYSPADAAELASVMPVIVARKRPAYLRLGKGGESIIHEWPLTNPERGFLVSGPPNPDLMILSTGAIGSNVSAGIELLHPDLSKRIAHYSLPLFEAVEYLFASLSNSSGIITVEEHTPSGGLGSLVLETLSAGQSKVPVKRIGTKRGITKVVGSHDYLLRRHELDPVSLAKEIGNFFPGLIPQHGGTLGIVLPGD